MTNAILLLLVISLIIQSIRKKKTKIYIVSIILLIIFKCIFEIVLFIETENINDDFILVNNLWESLEQAIYKCDKNDCSTDNQLNLLFDGNIYKLTDIDSNTGIGEILLKELQVSSFDDYLDEIKSDSYEKMIYLQYLPQKKKVKIWIPGSHWVGKYKQWCRYITIEKNFIFEY